MSNYTPRLTAPSESDLRWIMIEAGGYNGCIPGAYPGGVSAYPSVLPNCTGYVHGRCMEIAGINTDDMGLSFGNAVEYWEGCTSDWEQSSEPSLGAVVVYHQNVGWQPGHVAIVEQIIDNDTIVISQSDYEIERFTTWTCTRATNWTPFDNVSFLGFLKNPYVTPGPGPGPGPSGKIAEFVLLSKYAKRRKQNVTKRFI